MLTCSRLKLLLLRKLRRMLGGTSGEVAVVDACKWAGVTREIFQINMVVNLPTITRILLAWMIFVV
jgi:hypothetical protein